MTCQIEASTRAFIVPRALVCIRTGNDLVITRLETHYSHCTSLAMIMRRVVVDLPMTRY